MQIGTSHHLELPTRLRHKLETYRRHVWVVKLAEGVLAGIFGLLVSYLSVFVLDRLGDTPAWLRLAMLLVGTTGFAIWFPLKWHRWVWRTRQLEQAARLLRHRFPRVGDRLLGIVELAHNDVEQERSESLCRAAMRQVDEDVQDYDFSRAVPQPHHKHWGGAAGVVVAAVVALLALVPEAGTNALARWLFPWRATERYTFVKLQDLPDELVVPYAEPFVVEASLAADSRWMPAKGKARYGRQPVVEQQRKSQQFRFSLPPQKEPDALTISVGDAKKHIDVAPTSRPELTEIMAHISLPDYLQYDRYPDQDVRSGSLSVVKGSRIGVTAVATRELASATLGDRAINTTQNRLDVPSRLVVESEDLELHWRDRLGLSSKAPFQLHVSALDDEAPSVNSTKLQREQVVLSTESLSFEVVARDDFGVKVIGLQWRGREDRLRNPEPAQGEMIVAAGNPRAQELPATCAFSAERLGITPQTLEVRLFAVDYLPDRQRVYSPTYVFHVLSPEEHAIWLTHQLRRWFQQATEVYEREEQLHEENRAIRALPSQRLDQPETRRRIEAQAAAEQNNARRLGTLSVAGQELVEMATRNEQFNVATLETWAEMIQKLKDISENRMPSVADLLTEAANAPGAQQTQPDESSPPGKTPPQVGENRDPRAGPAGKSEPAESQGTVPNVTDVESGFNELDQEEKDSPPPGKSKPKFGLPTTDIVGGGAPQDDESEACPPAEEKMDEAIEEQEDLLAEFAKVADELKKLLGDLEGSTFVKRLKAASRRQLKVAENLNQTLEAGFGKSSFEMPQRRRSQLGDVAEREVVHADDIYVIQDDLEAYYNRVQEGKFRTVFNEMKSSQVVSNVQGIAKAIDDNLGGQSIAQTEYWASELDRWAEQLVGPG